MANDPIIEIKPGGGLESGLFPAVEPTAGPLWRSGRDIWFRPLSINSALGKTKLISVIGRTAKEMAQAFADGEQRLYYEDLGVVFKYANGVSGVIGELDTQGQYDFEVFGTWLVATDNVNNVKLWKNDDNGFISIGSAQFARGKIVKKLANRILVYSTDILPSGFHYCKISDPETWTPTAASGAGNLPLRDLDSEIIAVANLGAAHGVYTEDRMVVVNYLGEGLKFGTPNQALTGIGAAGINSVISWRDKNFGLFRGGVFITDGADFKLLDEPAVREWLQENVDWSRGEEIIGYHDKRMGKLCWSLPRFEGNMEVLTMDEQFHFSFLSRKFYSALKQDIFDTGFVSLRDGIYLTSVNNTLNGDFTLRSQLLDAGNRGRYKHWDYAIFEGQVSGEVRFGFTDLPNYDNITWYDWQAWNNLTPFEPRESVFFALQMSSEDQIKLTGVKIYGTLAGLVT